MHDDRNWQDARWLDAGCAIDYYIGDRPFMCRDPRRQLEQHVQCGCLQSEFEQPAVEFE